MVRCICSLVLLFTVISPSHSQRLTVDTRGHRGVVWDIMFAEDEKSIFTASADNTVRMWEVESGELQRTFRPYIAEGRILTADVHNNLIAIAGSFDQGKVILIDANLMQQVGELTGSTGGVLDLEFSPDGNHIITTQFDGTFNVYDVSRKARTSSFAGGKRVIATTFSPDGNRVAVVTRSGEGYILFADVLKGGGKNPTFIPFYSGSQPLRAITYSDDGQYLAAGGDSGEILLFQADGTPLKTLDKAFNGITTLSFARNEPRLVATVAEDNEAWVYQVPDGRKEIFFREHEGRITASAFSSSDEADFMNDGVIATYGGINNDIYIWDVLTGKEMFHLTGESGPYATVSLKGNRDNLLLGYTQLRPGATVRQSFDLEQMQLKYAFVPAKEKLRTVGSLSLSQTGPASIALNGNTVVDLDPTASGPIIDFGFTSSGKIVAGTTSSVGVYSLDGNLEKEFAGHQGALTDFDLSDDFEILATSSADQTIQIWDLTSGELLATYFSSNDNEWIMFTPQGFYDASAGGEKYMGWSVESPGRLAQFYPASSYRDKFLKPAVVKQQIMKGSVNSAAVGASKQDTEEEEATEVEATGEYEEIVISESNLPPSMEWISPRTFKTETDQKTVTVKAKVSSDSEITLIKLLTQNTRSIGDDRGFKVIGETGTFDKIIEYDLELKRKETMIKVLAKNEHGKLVSEERIIIYTGEMEGDSRSVSSMELLDISLKPNLYLLSIGISDFENSEYNLNLADDDATAVSRAFLNQEGNMFDKVIYRNLIDSNATKSEIIASFDWLAENATENDLVAVFVATHGMNYQNEFFLLPHDGKTDDLKASCVSWSEIIGSLNQVPSNLLLMLDACHSGQLGTNVLNSDNKEAIREASSPENGIIIMSASTGAEVAQENTSWGHGAFTYALLQGLEKGLADFKPDKLIFLRELDLFVSEKVLELTNNQQHPTTQKPSVISRMPLYQIPDNK